MWRLSWRELRSRRGQFVLSILAVMLATAFLATTLGLRENLNELAKSALTSVYTADFYAVGPPNTQAQAQTQIQYLAPRDPVNPELLPIIEVVPGVKESQLNAVGTAILLNKDGEALGLLNAPALITPVLSGLGPKLYQGKLPDKTGQIALDHWALARAGLKIGDPLVLVAGGKTYEQSIVGATTYGAPLGLMTSASLDPQVAKDLFATAKTVNSIAITLKESPADPRIVQERIQEAVGPDAQILSGAALREQSAGQLGQFVAAIAAFALVFAGLALGVCVFLVSNTFQISLRPRWRQFALLRSLGTSRRQIWAIGIYQALIVGVLGAGLGLALGVGALFGLRAWVASYGFILGEVSWAHWPTLLLSFVVGVGVTLLASLAPASRSSRISPLQALRRGNLDHAKPLRRRGLLGLLLALSAAGLLVLALWWLKFSATAHLVLGAGILVGVLALILLSPVLAKIFLILLNPLVRRLSKVSGTLAVANLLRDPRRAASTSGALLAGLALVSCAGVLASSATASLGGAMREEIHADLVVSTLTGVRDASQASGILEKIPGIAKVNSSFQTGSAKLLRGRDTELVVKVAAWNYSDEKTLKLHVGSGDVREVDAGRLLVTKTYAQTHGIKLGDSVTLSTAGGVYTTTVGALVSSRSYRADFYVDSQSFGLIKPENPGVDWLLVTVDGGAKVLEVQKTAAKNLSGLHVYRVQTSEEFLRSAAGTIEQFLVMLYALLGLSIFIALLGIMNALSLSVLERSRELALGRAIGMTPRATRSTLRFEAVLTSLFGTLVGVGVGVGLGAALVYYLRPIAMFDFSLPVFLLVAMALGALLAGWLASLIPASLAARVPILGAISG